MGYTRTLLAPDEEIVVDSHPHWKALIGPVIVAALAVAAFVGWGLVVNTSASWLSWQGYLLGPIGGREGAWAYSNIGILLAMVIAFLGYLLTSRGRVARQEEAGARTFADTSDAEATTR